MTAPPRPARLSSVRWLPPARRVGPLTVAGLAAALTVLWLVVGPAGGDWLSFLGQLAGAEAILVLSIALVLISTLPWVESWFDGIDRTAIWHRRLAITGLVLLIPHIALSANPARNGLAAQLGSIATYGLVALAVWSILPRWRSLLPAVLRPAAAVLIARTAAVPAVDRVVAALLRLAGGYERWRSVHRLTGLFVAAAFVHGLLDATAFTSSMLRWSYVVLGGIGVAVYVYRETVARYFLPLHDYQVATVTPVGPGLTEIALTPIGPPMAFTPGQFAMLFLEGRNGWRRHPFTLSGAPHDGVLRFTIKALGDDTGAMDQVVRPGMPAVVGGPHGRFTHAKGTDEQVWIAGGIGVTPFLSWMRTLDRHPVHGHVEFFYTSAGPPPFAEEITAIATGYDNVHVHLIDSVADGYLTPADVLGVLGQDPRRVSVFLCGPAGMVRTFTQAFARAGIPGRNVHREHFDWR